MSFLSQYLSMGVKEIGCFSRPEISEYSFKILIELVNSQFSCISFKKQEPKCQSGWKTVKRAILVHIVLTLMYNIKNR